MGSISINKSISYKSDSCHTEIKNPVKNKHIDNSKPADSISPKTISESMDSSDISDDALLSYKFSSRLEASIKNTNNTSSIEKYTKEYEEIKKEIDSGKYGNDVKKYTKLLDNAFKDVTNKISDYITEIAKKESKPKFTPARTVKYNAIYQNATCLSHMFKAEHKTILKKIEYYKKKKNNEMVAALTRLRDVYKHLIENVSGITAQIKSDLDDSFSSDSDK